MVDYIQIAWQGLVSGFAYALIGLALVMVYKTARILNFAAGTMAGISGFLAHWWAAEQDMPFGIAILFAMIMTGAGTYVVERLTVRPLVKLGDFLPIVIMTLGVEEFLANVSLLWWGGTARRYRVPGDIDRINWLIGDFRLNAWHLVVAITTFVTLSIVGYIINQTELGLGMKAFAEDQDAAKLMGIKESTVSIWTWVLSALVGGVTGLVFAPVLFLQQDYMNIIFIKGFVAAILGGFLSLSGGVAGGLLLGELEAFTIKWAPREFAAALPVVIVFIVLLIRPHGLFTREKGHERV